MALQFEVSNVRGNRLTILAKNASWATRLRFDTPRLLNQLCELQEFSQIEEIKIRSVSSLEPSVTHRSLSENMSTPANEPLEELAARTEQDELKNIVNNSVKIALSFIHNGIDQTMNIHNTKNLMDENIY